nr:unnamed protein product [Callosobruchus analis]
MLMPGSSRAKPKSPPSSSRTKPVAQRNQNHTGGTLNSGGTGATGAIICPNCDRSYMTKSSLAKHLLSCGVRDRSGGVRLHEARMHTGLDNEARRKDLKMSEAEIFQRMAEIQLRQSTWPS